MVPKSKRILIIDDSALIRELLTQVVEALDFSTEVRVAKNGTDVVELFQKGYTFDLVTLDMNMPDMDGIHILKKIRLFDDAVKVIVISSNLKTSRTDEYIHLGVEHFAAKPFDSDELKKQLTKIFEEE
ncbi:MAG TPA: response regulator [Turneriella sp.]|nr:response regulator [Turneriella sp.]